MRDEDMEQSNCCLILKRHYVKINGKEIPYTTHKYGARDYIKFAAYKYRGT